MLFFHNAGVGAEFFWKASQSDNYAGQGFNYRPVIWDVNAVYSPKLASHAYLELVGGIGALSTRYYTGTTCGIYSCSNYQSSNHFDADFGGGIKLYPTRNFFIRPEARVYLINNNLEFSSNHATRYGDLDRLHIPVEILAFRAGTGPRPVPGSGLQDFHFAVVTFRPRALCMIAIRTSGELKQYLWMVSIETDTTRRPSPASCLRGFGRLLELRPRPTD